MKARSGFILLYFLYPLLMIGSIVLSPMAHMMSGTRIAGLILGILAYFMMCAQILLAARIPCLDRAFGLDRLIRFHGMAALLAFLFALAHPFVIHGLRPFKFLGRFGEDALLLYFLTILLAVFFLTTLVSSRVRWAGAMRRCLGKNPLFRYRFQLALHNLTALAVLLMFLHVVFRFRGFGSNMPFTVLAVVLFAAAACAYLWHAFLRRGYRYTISKVVHENPAMTTLWLQPEGKEMAHKAGQFAYFKINDEVVSSEPHPFSISSAPGDPLTVTIRDLGDWTHEIKNVKAGSEVRIDGPYGKFTPEAGTAPIILIAGGVGITPMMGIVKEERKREEGRPVVLFWCAKNHDELIRLPEWEALEESMPSFTFCPILSREKESGYETGHFSSEIFEGVLHREEIPVQQAEVYYCGPEPLRKTVHTVLAGEGIPEGHIHEERFSL